MSDPFNLVGKSAAELWRQIEGFTPPTCPVHPEKRPHLDDDGFYCLYCITDGSEGDDPPSNGSLPNGAEFDAYLDAWRAARRLERLTPQGDPVRVEIEGAVMFVSTFSHDGSIFTRVQAEGAATLHYPGDVASYDAAFAYYHGIEPGGGGNG